MGSYSSFQSNISVIVDVSPGTLKDTFTVSSGGDFGASLGSSLFWQQSRSNTIQGDLVRLGLIWPRQKMIKAESIKFRETVDTPLIGYNMVKHPGVPCTRLPTMQMRTRSCRRENRDLASNSTFEWVEYEEVIYYASILSMCLHNVDRRWEAQFLWDVMRTCPTFAEVFKQALIWQSTVISESSRRLWNRLAQWVNNVLRNRNVESDACLLAIRPRRFQTCVREIVDHGPQCPRFSHIHEWNSTAIFLISVSSA